MLKAKHKTGLIFFPAFDWAISPTHPEREERLLYTQDQVREEGIFDIDGIIEIKPDIAKIHEIQRTHFCIPNEPEVTTPSHLISAGASIKIGTQVMDGSIDKGFALVRPPGHHAMRIVHGARGFCNINNEAIMIEHLRTNFNVKKIAIVDTDCHHGDGTQDIYWHDPDVLFISIHQDGRTLYPGSGFITEMGGPNAIAKTINIPLPPHTSEEGFLYAIKNIVLPILKDFQPDLIVNSAGQDNHYSDPITNMNFSAQGYAALTEILQADIAVLEGGYSIEGALPYVNLGLILAMAGMDYSHVKEPDYNFNSIRQSAVISDSIKEIGDSILKIWDNRDTLRERAIDSQKFATRQRNIYYDTDGIYETQNETVKICHDCGGCLQIDSSSDTGKRINAIHIPVGGCSVCQNTALEWFDTGTKGYDYTILQNRVQDQYLTKK